MSWTVSTIILELFYNLSKELNNQVSDIFKYMRWLHGEYTQF